ncbi:hypothetical protein SAMN05421819_1138 [Bryocella elongata]|uniref:Uncharacterized protein n=1 Tax=Bryocella elongata TaxID=863522 RepID=A0A1H5UQQ8_9BACT|nr:hypothetical protein [Bryocella elongata]SEF77314.1 hypothetical protein SAMN05421819_1138 [Bryocella elongata]
MELYGHQQAYLFKEARDGMELPHFFAGPGLYGSGKTSPVEAVTGDQLIGYRPEVARATAALDFISVVGSAGASELELIPTAINSGTESDDRKTGLTRAELNVFLMQSCSCLPLT